jgi:hypothetical protein
MRRNLVAAIMIALASPALAHGTGVHAKGTVNDVSTTKIVVETAQGAKAFKVTPRTRFVKRGAAVSSSDIRSGDRVVVHGIDVKGELEATDVRAGDPAPKQEKK